MIHHSCTWIRLHRVWILIIRVSPKKLTNTSGQGVFCIMLTGNVKILQGTVIMLLEDIANNAWTHNYSPVFGWCIHFLSKYVLDDAYICEQIAVYVSCAFGSVAVYMMEHRHEALQLSACASVWKLKSHRLLAPRLVAGPSSLKSIKNFSSTSFKNLVAPIDSLPFLPQYGITTVPLIARKNWTEPRDAQVILIKVQI